jgi:hypothetical protein
MGSASRMLSALYPEFDWSPWQFVNRSHNIFENRKFFDWAGEQLGLKHWTDWYNVSHKVDIKK